MAQPAAKPQLKSKELTYLASGVSYKSYIVYDASLKGKRPGILVLPEWWGVNSYVRKRADMLAAQGYVAIAVDMYGDGKLAATPDEAQKMASPFYANPKACISPIEAAEKQLKGFEMTDPNQIGAIGYCFGGSMALTAAKLGADFRATVSFHGGLAGIDAAPDVVKGTILVCHGGADKFVSTDDVAKFRSNLDAAGVKYTFTTYEDATHAFTNPDATENGKKFNMPIAYNARADKESWLEMTNFLKAAFPKK